MKFRGPGVLRPGEGLARSGAAWHSLSHGGLTPSKRPGDLEIWMIWRPRNLEDLDTYTRCDDRTIWKTWKLEDLRIGGLETESHTLDTQERSADLLILLFGHFYVV